MHVAIWVITYTFLYSPPLYSVPAFILIRLWIVFSFSSFIISFHV